ncbi:MAG: hypothetical protein LBQ39_11205 [Tannerellaceae bacterium]|jgi:hypothetical protein|nr:hypothetical protein [Tannerellaceae bacterium]
MQPFLSFSYPELRLIATHAPFSLFRRMAITMITSQEFLKDRALNDSDGSLRKEAILNITDQEFLKDRALNDSDIGIRFVVTEKLLESSKDQTLLKALVSTLTEKLKTSGSVNEREESAKYLQAIYKRYPDKSIRNKIQELNGIIIRKGTEPTGGIHTDYDVEEGCANCPCTYVVEHVSFYTGSGTPGEPTIYFDAEKRFKS